MVSADFAVPVDCVGSPYLSKLQSELRRAPNGEIVFASEPSLPSYRETHGFDQFDSLRYALNFLKEGYARKDTRLAIKLHPIEEKEKFEEELKRRGLDSSLIYYTALTKKDLLSSVRTIWGMRSMLLFEAAVLGIPVISFQPDRKTKCTFLDKNPNVLTIDGSKFNVQVVEEFLNAPIRPIPKAFDEQSYLRIVSGLLRDHGRIE